MQPGNKVASDGHKLKFNKASAGDNPKPSSTTYGTMTNTNATHGGALPVPRSPIPLVKTLSGNEGPPPPSKGRKDQKRKKNKVSYYERLGGYLHPRDLRRLTTPFSATNEPELVVRRHVMLFNFSPVRAM
jgi:hypothetical protein